jgi:Mrp family chromosome partitioning ATPase
MSMAKDTSCKTCNSETCSAKERREKESLEEFLERQALAERLCKIGHKILVLSGKGGVGKSTVAANLAVSLATQGFRTGLLDIDLHGPSIPKLLHLEGRTMGVNRSSMEPVTLGDNLKVISIGFLLRSADDAVIWRGPLKMGVIKQFLRDVDWGELDYLIVDSPPGTGDEPLSICQLIEGADGAIVVTTPQEVAISDVRKCITFCRQLKMPVLGVVENMSGFACPHCGETTNLFKAGGGERMAAQMGVPFLARIPIDPAVVESGDAGRPLVYHHPAIPAADAFARLAEALRGKLEKEACHAT